MQSSIKVLILVGDQVHVISDSSPLDQHSIGIAVLAHARRLLSEVTHDQVEFQSDSLDLIKNCDAITQLKELLDQTGGSATYQVTNQGMKLIIQRTSEDTMTFGPIMVIPGKAYSIFKAKLAREALRILNN